MYIYIGDLTFEGKIISEKCSSHCTIGINPKGTMIAVVMTM